MNLAYEIWRTNPATGTKEFISSSRIHPADNAPGIELPLALLNTHWFIRIALVRPWYQYVETWLYVAMSLLLSLFLATIVQRNRDLTAIRQYLEAIAYKDPLTGALNRRGLFDEMARRTQPENSNKFTLYYIDLNKFKAINDTYGHEAGDRVLQHFADTVRTCVQAAHVLGRLGGDEFVLLLSGVPDPVRRRAAFDAMRIALAAGLPKQGVPGPFTFSIGQAVYPDDADNADGLLSKADEAMYRHKEYGRLRSDQRDKDSANPANPPNPNDPQNPAGAADQTI
jgi:diguanylate cyclase (GGDEF)-like protein